MGRGLFWLRKASMIDKPSIDGSIRSTISTSCSSSDAMDRPSGPLSAKVTTWPASRRPRVIYRLASRSSSIRKGCARQDFNVAFAREKSVNKNQPGQCPGW